MPNIFYKVQFKTELEGLNVELKNSMCQGLLIPKRQFFKKNKSTGKDEIDTQFIKTLISFDKKSVQKIVILLDAFLAIRSMITYRNAQTRAMS